MLSHLVFHRFDRIEKDDGYAGMSEFVSQPTTHLSEIISPGDPSVSVGDYSTRSGSFPSVSTSLPSGSDSSKGS